MRTLEQIKASADAKLAQLLPGLNNVSGASVYLKLRDLAAALIFTFESLMYDEMAQLEAETERKRYGRLDWYADEAKKWQNGHQLTFVENTGELVYLVDDAAARLVTHAAVSEGGNGVLTLKVAKTVSNALEPLSVGELPIFRSYIEQVAVAGTAINVISVPGDDIAVLGDLFFNATMVQADVSTAVIAAMEEFRDTIDFNGTFLVNAFIAKVRAVPGVIDFKPSSILATPNGGDSISIVRDYLLAAGYFNYSGTPDAGIDYHPQQPL